MKDRIIGWIGTGLMGNPMAGHLLRHGYRIYLHNRTRRKAENLIADGAVWFDTPAEVAEHSQIVFTIIGYPRDVEEVYFGKDGILSRTRPGMILVDMTTTRPALSVRISEEARKLKAFAVDAPVSGGEMGAVNGTLSVMAGGEKQIVEKITPVFEIFGKNIVYQGPAGSGQHTKMCNQITIAGTMIGVCEALVYGTRAGLDAETVLKSISKGAAGCWTLDVLAPKMIQGDFEPGFMVDHLVKDLGIALEEAEQMKLSLPGLALVRQLYIALQSLGHGRLGTQALYMAVKHISGLK
ncbi:MAG: NAD(P)-dependent oxidoreductase [Bacteroidales bacterium]|nr:NAD(P)-dependent oxidoreductase [Bacteroidales bacterium]MBN2699734.1 NAD(P)-dependent oxidoreductase [Bacteroidales bacterium]